jgi:formylglycine-generating enzyme required for sulfatase activity
LVVDDIKGNDHMFLAQLIDAKDSKLSGKGSYVRTGIATGDLPRVSSALTKQLEGPERRRSAPAPARSYLAELDIEMVFVEGGAFQIGCGTTDAPCYTLDNREKPQRTVTLSNFYIGKYEITQAQWKAVMEGHPFQNAFYWGGVSGCGAVPCDDQRPVEYVSWIMVDTAFLPRLRALTGKNYRLPTNAEWEYAARGCKAGKCDPYKYSGSDIIGDIAWYAQNSSLTTHPVGQKKPNSLGIHDMCGNVWEWCWDCFDANHYQNRLTAGNNVDPKHLDCAATSNRRVRGGRWANDVTTSWLRVACSESYTFNFRSEGVGFRLVLPAQ